MILAEIWNLVKGNWTERNCDSFSLEISCGCGGFGFGFGFGFGSFYLNNAQKIWFGCGSLCVVGTIAYWHYSGYIHERYGVLGQQTSFAVAGCICAGYTIFLRPRAV